LWCGTGKRQFSKRAGGESLHLDGKKEKEKRSKGVKRERELGWGGIIDKND
jgi:hypothetical protein